MQLPLKYILLLIFIYFFASGNTFSQQENQPISTGEQVLYRNEYHGGALIHTNGFGVFFRKGVHKTYKIKQFWELDLVNMKHPKEVRSTNPFIESAKGYVYGKENSLTVLRAGYGQQRVISQKDKRRGVEVRYLYYGGASLGFLKPIYLEIINLTPTQERFISTEKYNSEEHRIDNIYGRAPFTRGISELRIRPGAYAKFGLNFEYSGLDDVVKQIETGVVLDAYLRDVPMMAFNTNRQFFLSFYLAFALGERSF